MSSSTEQQVLAWLNHFVIGLNLCPFAAPVVRDKRLRISVTAEKKVKLLAQQLFDELRYLEQTPVSEVSTTLLVFENGLKDFYSYLDFLSVGQALLTELELEGVIQLASFHPDYLFEGEVADDDSHYTNRSPYPIIHLIREAELAAALEKYPNAESIPQRNIQKLRELGMAGILKLQTSYDYSQENPHD